MLKQITNAIVLILALFTCPAFAEHGPGGGPNGVLRHALTNLIQDESFGLKSQMKLYLNSIHDKEGSSDPNGKWLVDNKKAILDHIDQSQFIVRPNSVEGYCSSSREISAPAATTQFDQDFAPIYFDLEALFEQTKGDSPELQKFKIEVTAFHEIRHQFQKAPAQGNSCTVELSKREDEANSVAGYVFEHRDPESVYKWSLTKAGLNLPWEKAVKFRYIEDSGDVRRYIMGIQADQKNVIIEAGTIFNGLPYDSKTVSLINDSDPHSASVSSILKDPNGIDVTWTWTETISDDGGTISENYLATWQCAGNTCSPEKCSGNTCSVKSSSPNVYRLW